MFQRGKHSRPMRLVLTLGLAASVTGLLQAADRTPVRCNKCNAGACVPNSLFWGFYPTQWRRWPGEPEPAVEAIPRPAPAKPRPEAPPTEKRPADDATPMKTQPEAQPMTNPPKDPADVFEPNPLDKPAAKPADTPADKPADKPADQPATEPLPGFPKPDDKPATEPPAEPPADPFPAKPPADDTPVLPPLDDPKSKKPADEDPLSTPPEEMPDPKSSPEPGKQGAADEQLPRLELGHEREPARLVGVEEGTTIKLPNSTTVWTAARNKSAPVIVAASDEEEAADAMIVEDRPADEGAPVEQRREQLRATEPAEELSDATTDESHDAAPLLLPATGAPRQIEEPAVEDRPATPRLNDDAVLRRDQRIIPVGIEVAAPPARRSSTMDRINPLRANRPTAPAAPARSATRPSTNPLRGTR